MRITAPIEQGDVTFRTSAYLDVERRMRWCGMPSISCLIGTVMRDSTLRRHARCLDDQLDLGLMALMPMSRHCLNFIQIHLSQTIQDASR